MHGLSAAKALWNSSVARRDYTEQGIGLSLDRRVGNRRPYYSLATLTIRLSANNTHITICYSDVGAESRLYIRPNKNESKCSEHNHVTMFNT